MATEHTCLKACGYEHGAAKISELRPSGIVSMTVFQEGFGDVWVPLVGMKQIYAMLSQYFSESQK